jgi:alanyl-tRNA synthetase
MLRTMVDDLKNQLGSTVIVLATVAEGKVSLIAGVSKDVTDRVKAGAGWYGRPAGGRQRWRSSGHGASRWYGCGGTSAAALASVESWVSAKL